MLARKYVTPSLRAIAIAATILVTQAHADEYTDVSQLVRTGKLAEALAKADQFLVAKPKDPQMRFLKGVIQRDTGKSADAIATFSRLAEDFPELPEPYNNLAVLYAGQSQFDKARTALEMAIRTNPSYATAHENLGDVYAKLASQAYTKALQLDNANQAVPPKLALIRELFTAPPAKVAKGPTPAPTAVAAAPQTPIPTATKPVASTPVSTTGTPPSPVVTPVSKPSVDAGNSHAEVSAAVKGWATAWSSKDVTTYLGAYGKEFDPPGAQNRSAWEQDRKARINGKSKIDVRIENLVVVVNDDKATAKFRQDYKAGTLAVSSRKTLELVKKGDRWQIVKETVGG